MRWKQISENIFTQDLAIKVYAVKFILKGISADFQQGMESVS